MTFEVLHLVFSHEDEAVHIFFPMMLLKNHLSKCKESGIPPAFVLAKPDYECVVGAAVEPLAPVHSKEEAMDLINYILSVTIAQLMSMYHTSHD